jgi:hypothetical protein
VSPEWIKNAGSSSRIASKIFMPPHAGLMPQPWPPTSPDQTNRRFRRAAGGAQKLPATGSLTSFQSARSTMVTR